MHNFLHDNLLHDKFSIFTMGRSGSNTLVKIISSTGTQCCHEPFIDEKVENVKDALAILKKKMPFDGIKTLKYQLDENIYLKVLNQFDKIIYLKRKNCLQTAISHTIAIQTLSWEYYKPALKPLNLDSIESYINDNRNADLIVQQLKNIKTILYEDMFGKYKTDIIKDVFNFLNIDFPITDEIKYLLSKKHKVNPEHTYANIPNLKEIISRFGSPYSNNIKSL